MERLTKYNVKLNPKKSIFVVSSCQLLGSIASSKGIEIDPDKIKAIKKILDPKIN